MTMIAAATTTVDRPATLPVPDILRRLRRDAARTRASARLDLFRACAMLSTDRGVAGRAYIDTFLRTLEQGLGRAPVIYCEACPQMSFDERWIMALVDAQRRGDRDSFAFLLCSRLPCAARRHVGFLIAGIARTTVADGTDVRKTA
ncbi:hypothetical protein ACVDG3_05500 [Meridianimarinicoccus sp. RP-17]|uniref:hypothetical protein n=1 Tax=Meridianimarinicoccus zhengii TaxID=2056810 RepID=UPI000DAC88AF|nr:hypothetical protein [Phycocomes zhengii]